MSDDVTCPAHGRQRAAFVCAHTVETLNDGAPRGLQWAFHDGAYDGVCQACAALPEEVWAERAQELGRALCVACFQQIAKINNIDLDQKAVS